MLPVTLVDDVMAVHMLLSVGLIVVFHEATNPGAVTLLSLVKRRNMFPDEAITEPGRDEPVNVPSRTPEASVPS